MTKPGRAGLHRRITEQIVETIEAGAGEYRMPWHPCTGSVLCAPHNPVGKYPYRGINILTLWCAQRRNGFRSSQWASYRQWLTAGRQVRQGERGTSTVRYSEQAPFAARPLQNSSEEEGAEAARTGFLLRPGTVFNADQVEGADEPRDGDLRKDSFPIAASLIAKSGAVIRPDRSYACYVPSLDEIHLPPRTSFVSEHAYYGVAFHELTHWTGHPARCARDLEGRFGSDSYAIEELVAELGSAFLSAEVGLAAEPRVDHARYIESWLRVLRMNERAIFVAAAKASVATSFLTGKATGDRVLSD
jgi:antirestriction protein ArdC